MYITDQDKHTVDNCRFCFMCRHVCPVGMVTGSEANNARARAELISMVARGFDYTADMAEVVYECALCGACTTQCCTGFDPLVFTRNARMEALTAGIAPDYINDLLDRIENEGSAYGPVTDEALLAEIASLPEKADTLLFLGNTAAVCPESAVAAIKLLKKAGVDFAVMKDEPDCGMDYADIVGPAEEARQFAIAASEKINAYGAKTVIALSPDSAKMFLREYREWGAELNADVRTFPAYVLTLMNEGKLTFTATEETVTYQDPFRLARELHETEAPRALISACANLKDMYRHGEEAISCGEGTIGLYRPDLTALMAARRMPEAVSVGAEMIITACPTSYTALKAVGTLPVKPLEVFLWEHC